MANVWFGFCIVAPFPSLYENNFQLSQLSLAYRSEKVPPYNDDRCFPPEQPACPGLSQVSLCVK